MALALVPTMMDLIIVVLTTVVLDLIIVVLTKLSALDLDLALTIVVLMILIVLDLTMDQAPCQDPTMIMDLVLTTMALHHTTVVLMILTALVPMDLDHMILMALVPMDLDLGRTKVDQAHSKN